MKKYALGVVGTGLIGGSMAIDLRRRGFAGSVLGVEADPVAAAAAEKLGIVDRVVPLEECVRESDIILVAVPVSAAIVVIGSVLDLFDKEGYADKIVMDVCSTKEKLAQAVLYHPCRKQLVLTHPIPSIPVPGRPSPTSLTGGPASWPIPRNPTRVRWRWPSPCMRR